MVQPNCWSAPGAPRDADQRRAASGLDNCHRGIGASSAAHLQLVRKTSHSSYITHLFEFPRGVWERDRDRALFLRADRARTFRLHEGEPLQTSFGEDLYDAVFADEGHRSVAEEAKAHVQTR